MPAQQVEFPVIETERLILGKISKDHYQWYFNHFSTKEIIEGQGFEGPKDIETAKEELNLYIVGLFEEARGIRWGIRFKDSDEIIGSCGFYAWNKDFKKADMGYDLQPAHWGQGIMVEAMNEAIRYGFEEMGLNRIAVTIMATNPRSRSLIKKLGFVQEGILRDYSKWNGEYVDEYLFALLRRDWESSKK